jgi:hypothetical protein
MAAWIEAGLRAALLSPALSAVSLLIWLVLRPLPASTTVLLMAVISGLVLDRWWVLRLRFDAQLFRALAEGRIHSLDQLDGGLAALALRQPPQAHRPLDSRIAGTRRLQRQHAMLCAAQAVMVVTAACIGWSTA